jgi:hypothetical protein
MYQTYYKARAKHFGERVLKILLPGLSKRISRSFIDFSLYLFTSKCPRMFLKPKLISPRTSRKKLKGKYRKSA